jgi:Fur family ferric uptake transcriptional regulator
VQLGCVAGDRPLESAGVAAGRARDEASALLRETGERVTPARRAVLAVLARSRRALSHHEVDAALGDARAVDRVTLYRVLDWLVERGLAHRVIGPDRTGRYSLARGARERRAYFQCSGCGTVICLERAAPRRVALPRGFRSEQVEVTVKGRCPRCAAARRAGNRMERV